MRASIGTGSCELNVTLTINEIGFAYQFISENGVQNSLSVRKRNLYSSRLVACAIIRG